jgi:hypothetical protein
MSAEQDERNLVAGSKDFSRLNEAHFSDISDDEARPIAEEHDLLVSLRVAGTSG